MNAIKSLLFLLLSLTGVLAVMVEKFRRKHKHTS